MSKQRLAVVILSSIGMLTTFMPWVSMPIVGSVSGSKGDGWFSFSFFLIALIIGLMGSGKKILSKEQILGISLFGVLAAILGIWKIIDFNTIMSTIDTEDNIFTKAFSMGISIEFGLYLLVLTGVLISILPACLKDKQEEIFKN